VASSFIRLCIVHLELALSLHLGNVYTMYQSRLARPWFELAGPRSHVLRKQVSLQWSKRRLHLAPPFLLDGYIPRYQLLSSVEASKKRSAAYAHLRKCNLCPRLCGVNRYEKTGTCLIGAETVKVNVIAPHFGEGKQTIAVRFQMIYAGISTEFIPPPRTLHPRTQWIRGRLLLRL
jgi:hypothetical protein